MKLFELTFEKAFVRKVSKLVKGSPVIDEKLTKTLNKLTQNPSDRSLKTHSLEGNLKGSYSCSLTRELRIIFKLTDKIVHLLDIGSHDEVY